MGKPEGKKELKDRHVLVSGKVIEFNKSMRPDSGAHL